MPRIKGRIYLISLIILIIIVIFFTALDIIYEEQIIHLLNYIYNRPLLSRILVLYIILLVFIIVLFFSQMTKKSNAVSYYERLLKMLIGEKLQHFKCPKCKEYFTFKNLKINENRSFIITCPCCGEIGKIPQKQKSPQIKFECKKCGEQVSIWSDLSKSTRRVQIYSCPYCGEKHSMKSS